MNRVELEQGSPEWLEWRRGMAMASETSAVMGINPYQGPEQIRAAKRGLDNNYMNDAMRRGHEQEPLAREAYERDTGELFQPAVYELDGYGASVDGITMDGETLLEIKSPYKGKQSERWDIVSEGGIHDYDYVQCQHQMMVTGAKRCIFLVWDGEEYVCTEIPANPEFWYKIVNAWQEFWPTVAARDDDEWAEAAHAYREAKKAADEAAQALSDAKQRLIDLSGGYSYGEGVRVKQVERAGQIDWKKVQKDKLADADLEQYRKAGSVFYQVEVVEE